MTGPRRRWVLRPTTGSGGLAENTRAIVVQVWHGQVLVDLPHGPVPLDPDEVEHLRRTLTEARAAALWDSGCW